MTTTQIVILANTVPWIIFGIVAITLFFKVFKPINSTKKDFLNYIKSKQYEMAYNMSSSQFKKNSSYFDFINYLKQTGLDNHISSRWYKTKLSGGVANIFGKIEVEPGLFTSCIITLTKEGKVRKVFSIKVPNAGTNFM